MEIEIKRRNNTVLVNFFTMTVRYADSTFGRVWQINRDYQGRWSTKWAADLKRGSKIPVYRGWTPIASTDLIKALESAYMNYFIEQKLLEEEEGDNECF